MLNLLKNIFYLKTRARNKKKKIICPLLFGDVHQSPGSNSTNQNVLHVCMFYRETRHLDSVHQTNLIGLNVMLSPEMSFMLIALYRPPSATMSFFWEVSRYAKSLHNMWSEVILMGDFDINREEKPQKDYRWIWPQLKVKLTILDRDS